MTIQLKSVEWSLADAIGLATRAVEELGANYVDDTSAYFPDADSRPGCIVGHMLAYAGMTYDDLTTAGETDRLLQNFNSEPVWELINWGFIVTDAHGRKFLEKLQAEQDEKHAWGGALEAAIENVDV